MKNVSRGFFIHKVWGEFTLPAVPVYFCTKLAYNKPSIDAKYMRFVHE